MSLIVETVSGKNLDKNTLSTIRKNSKSTIGKEVVSDKAKVTKSSNGQNIQYNDTDIKCTLCGNKYKTTTKMLQRHMNAKHADQIFVTCVMQGSEVQKNWLTINYLCTQRTHRLVNCVASRT